jgi:hypothetical protein
MQILRNLAVGRVGNENESEIVPSPGTGVRTVSVQTAQPA